MQLIKKELIIQTVSEINFHLGVISHSNFISLKIKQHNVTAGSFFESKPAYKHEFQY